jgi:ComF family protein
MVATVDATKRGVSAWHGALSRYPSTLATIGSFCERSWLACDCLLCAAASAEAICTHCLADLPLAGPGEHLQDGTSAQSLWRYETPADAVVIAFKYGGAGALATLWARQMAPLAHSHDIVIAMPMHLSRLRQRGENPVERLATALQRTQRPMPRRVTATRTRQTAQQQGLDRQSRLANVSGAFRIDASLQGQRVLLVDDVLTTGASLMALAEAARSAGASAVAAVTLARALT